jgi:hypothetical protein
MFKSTRKKERPPQSSRTKEKSASLSPGTKRSKAATKLQSTFKNKVAKAEDCALCLAKMLYYKEQGTLATCGHTFHKKCIKDLITRGIKICPLCRREFSANDIITPKEYEKLVYKTHNQPHTLNKTLRLYENEVYTACNQPYEDYKKALIAAVNAWSDYDDHNHDPPHQMLPTYYLWKKKDARLLQLKNKTQAIADEKYKIFQSKCKNAHAFELALEGMLDPNRYNEFNDYVQSIYKTRNP